MASGRVPKILRTLSSFIALPHEQRGSTLRAISRINKMGFGTMQNWRTCGKITSLSLQYEFETAK